MHFQTVDRMPFLEWNGPWEETIQRWCTEGFPIGKRFENFFGFDKKREGFPIDLGPIPQFVSKIIEENENYKIYVDSRGIMRKVRNADEKHVIMSNWFDFPVKSRKDWEEMKERYDPSESRRYPKTWSDELIEYYNYMDHPIELEFDGFFSFPIHLMGWQRFLTNLYKDPGLIQDILDFWADFLVKILNESLKEVRIDYAVLNEDLAYNSGPAISPKIFEDFLLPKYKKVTRCFRNHGIDVIGMDSDGNFEVLIPLLLEGGINCFEPLEAVAKMDAVVLREKFGEHILLIGNIDKFALMGGNKTIEAEVNYKFMLVEEGGFIPSIDHTISSDISFKNYSYYINLYKKRLNM
jgi:uroporphyrinogen decarboxylase